MVQKEVGGCNDENGVDRRRWHPNYILLGRVSSVQQPNQPSWARFGNDESPRLKVRPKVTAEIENDGRRTRPLAPRQIIYSINIWPSIILLHPFYLLLLLPILLLEVVLYWKERGLSLAASEDMATGFEYGIEARPRPSWKSRHYNQLGKT